jgi:hypothetical protein
MLPDPWKNLGIKANLTLSDSEIELPNRDDDPAFPGQADIVANIIPYYKKGPLTMMLAYN